MFDIIIAKRFEKHPGHNMVQMGQFALEEEVTGREVNRETDWTMCLRPGQKINMSMVFPDTEASSNHCPRCQTKSAASSDDRTRWWVSANTTKP
jgi:hypothetical protein